MRETFEIDAPTNASDYAARVHGSLARRICLQLAIFSGVAILAGSRLG